MMVRAHREETDEVDSKANETARVLLKNADLPLLILARVCIVLCYSNEEDFLDWAEEGVHIGK